MSFVGLYRRSWKSLCVKLWSPLFVGVCADSRLFVLTAVLAQVHNHGLAALEAVAACCEQ